MNKHLKCFLKYLGALPLMVISILLIPFFMFYLIFVHAPLYISGCVEEELFDPCIFKIWDWYAKL